MPYIYKNARENFASFEHFKEVAVKTLNEIYGRKNPMDVVDFSLSETHYTAIGYYDHEAIPAEQAEGAPLSGESAAAEQLARDTEAANKKTAVMESAQDELRIKALYAAKEPVSFEDLILAAKLGIDLPEELAVQLVEKVKAGHMSFEAAHSAGLKEIDGVPTLEAAKNALKAAAVNAEVAEQNKEAAASTAPVKNLPKNVKQIGGKFISDAALELARANSVDINKIEGTGRDGTIKVDDVKDYIDNHAPAKDNANENTDKQSNA